MYLFLNDLSIRYGCYILMLMETMLVTGGAGFIGSNFIYYERMAHPDYRIVCVDKLTYAGNINTLMPLMPGYDNSDDFTCDNFRFVKMDICDRDGIDRIFSEEKPDAVVNFAAESHVDRSIENPQVFLQTNVIGTASLLDAEYGLDV